MLLVTGWGGRPRDVDVAAVLLRYVQPHSAAAAGLVRINSPQGGLHASADQTSSPCAAANETKYCQSPGCDCAELQRHIFHPRLESILLLTAQHLCQPLHYTSSYCQVWPSPTAGSTGQVQHPPGQPCETA
jgi:hypothetical protein